MKFLFFLFFVLFLSQAKAQSFYTGAVIDPSSLISSSATIPVFENLFQSSFTEYFKTWGVDFSTDSFNGSDLLFEKSGLERSELVMLAMIAKQNKTSFYSLFLKAKSVKSIEKIATENKFDIKKNFKQAIKIKEEIEKKSGDDLNKLGIAISSDTYENY